MKYLFAVALATGAFEAVAAATPDSPGLGPRLAPGIAAAVFLGCAWALWSRRSVLAANAIGVLLVVELAGTPFYGRTSVHDWVLQLGFAAVATVGIVAWIDVLRRRSTVPVETSR
jgi:hypothetical protein